MSEIQNLEPKNLWRNFYALTQVPRPSGHLDKVRNFLLNWAKEHSIEAHTDNAGNVIMRKAATPGYEKLQMVTMQAHMDMVPQKVKESNHDFENDPIETYIDGDWVKAKGTTLGSDDGIGVATVMAVMEDDTLKHGPLEALLTVDEETCMYGVNNLQADTLQGRILLNFDDETEGQVIIGSAGGVNVTAELEYKEVPTFREDVAIKVEISGLKGGHSGLEINEGRANANKLLARFVREAIANFGARLAEWHGGNMRNAIPRDAEAVLTAPKEDIEELKKAVPLWEDIFKQEYGDIEKDLSFKAEDTALPATEIPEEIQDNIVGAVMACHDGVLRYIPSIPEIVETSSNLAIINIGGGKAEARMLVRSASDSMRRYCADTVGSAFAMAGMKITHDGDYPAWEPNPESPIVKTMVKVYKELFGEDEKVRVIHAGLECGVIGAVYPDMDMVSFGPTLRSPHTPNERCNIPSVAKYYKFVTALLENIPEKK